MSTSHFLTDDTIAAIATPPGEGGVAIVRISGPDAIDVADRIFSGAVHIFPSHTLHYGFVINEEGDNVDEVLMVPFLGGRSYTGEPVVEIHCHGGVLITRNVLDVVLQAGARPARAGEFTERAFLNGKLDLAQAEAVQNLISAKNQYALKAAEGQLEGHLSKKVRSYQERLLDPMSIIEAWIDYPEEDLEFSPFENVIVSLEEVVSEMEHLLSRFKETKMWIDGIGLCLVGAPNVGKSSIMNQLLGKEKAIVSSTPGTTRDLIDAEFRLSGLHFRLTDTAGVRITDEEIEKEGIRRSYLAMERADLVLLVLDLEKGLREEDAKLLNDVPKEKTIVVWNKCDLKKGERAIVPLSPVVELSAKTGEGILELEATIDQLLFEGKVPTLDEAVITTERHYEALTKAKEGVLAAIAGLKERRSAEFVSSDLRLALSELSTILGQEITEELLSRIFSNFCVGK